MNERMSMGTAGIIVIRQTQVGLLLKKIDPVPLHQPQIPHGMACY
jgi:hypothetical protein